LRCSRCGNDNPETNRFCGMCGATVLQPPSGTPDRPRAASTSIGQPGTQGAATSAATEPHNPPPRADSTPEDVPPISGPSFLGLNDPPPKPAAKPARSKANLSIDPGLPGSRSLDYLLDDEEESKGGAGKYFVIVLAVLLLLAFGYMRWKSEGFPWLASNTKPSAAAPNSDSGESNSSTPAPPASAPPPSSAAPANPAPTNSAPANSGAANSGTNAAGNNAPANSASPGAAGSSSAGNSAAASGNSAPAQPAASEPNAPSGSSQPGGSQPGGTSSSPAASPSGDQDSDDDNTAADKGANAAADTPAAKPEPPPKPRPAIPKDQVAEARKYLYGVGGVAQSCDRGMRLLKPLAEQANAKAMIEMGALYSAGLCTPRDLPTAYRWFALALRKDPDNQPLQSDLQKLWGEMTQPERQLAIRLSQ
jgi:hypothetical protein